MSHEGGSHETVATDFVATDKATPALRGIAGWATKAAGSVGRMLDKLSMVAGIGGVFAVGHAISDIDQTYKAVGRVRAVTGLAAENAYGMLQAFKLSGIEVTAGERIITRMARKTETVEEGMGGGAKRISALYRHLGIDIKAGPEQQMLQMAKAAQANKLGVADLGRAWGVPVGQAADMIKMLRKGPEHMKEIMDAAKKSGGVIDAAALTQYETMQAAKRKLSEGWENLVGTLYKAVIPAFTRIMEVVSAAFERWEPTIKKVADYLTDHMETIVALAGKFAKLMVIHKTLGLVGLGGVGGAAQKAASIGGKAIGWATKGMLGGEGAGPLGVIFALVKSLGKLTFLGVIVAVLVGIVKYVKDHWAECGAGLMSALKKIGGAFAHLWHSLEPLYEWIGAKAVPAIEWLLDAFGTLVDGIGDVVDWIIVAVQKLGVWMSAIPAMWDAVTHFDKDAIVKAGTDIFKGLAEIDSQQRVKSISNDMMKTWGHVMGMMKRPKAAETPDGRPESPHNDFRGSRFDIRQNFAEGFDPGRIALAFSHDLAKLGERRTQSGLAPIYAAGLR